MIEAAIHEPTDSSLRVDCVRVLTRLLREAGNYVTLEFTNHLRHAKRRALAIQHAAKAEQRVPLYRDLLKVAGNCGRGGVALRRTLVFTPGVRAT